MDLTSLGLKKPLGSESYDIVIPNSNMDLLDTLLAALQSGLTSAQKYKLTADTGYVLRDATNCDSEITTGVYSATVASTNKPSTTAGLLRVQRISASNVDQTVYSDKIYWRISANSGGTWSAWITLVNSTELALKLNSASYTAADVLAKLLTVDGSGSLVDSDLLDGQHGSYYSPTTHNHTLDDLSNATIVANSAGEILKWNGTAWVNNTLAEAGISAAGHLHAIADVSLLQTALNAKQDSLGFIAVPITRTVNAKALSANILLNPDDLDDATSLHKFVSANEITKLSNLSGTNTGNETNATIKTALGITILSGSNTGDQTISSLGAATFKTGTGTFALGGTTCVITDAFITTNTMVIVSPTQAKVGSWSVVSSAGSFTITSDATETANVTFDWGGTK